MTPCYSVNQQSGHLDRKEPELKPWAVGVKPPSVPPGHVPPWQTTCPSFRRPSISPQGQGTPGPGALPLPQLCSQPTCVLSRPQARAADPPGLGRRAQPGAPRTWREGGGAPEQRAQQHSPTCGPGLSTPWAGALDRRAGTPGALPKTADAQAAGLPAPLVDRTPGHSRATPGTGQGAAIPCRPTGGASHPAPAAREQGPLLPHSRLCFNPQTPSACERRAGATAAPAGRSLISGPLVHPAARLHPDSSPRTRERHPTSTPLLPLWGLSGWLWELSWRRCHWGPVTRTDGSGPSETAGRASRQGTRRAPGRCWKTGRAGGGARTALRAPACAPCPLRKGEEFFKRKQ